jgi:hypothetical protein
VEILGGASRFSEGDLMPENVILARNNKIIAVHITTAVAATYKFTMYLNKLLYVVWRYTAIAGNRVIM